VSDNELQLAGISAAGADGTGLLWMAPTGSTAPVDSGTALAAAWKNMGGLTEAGVSIKNETSTKDFKIYGSTAIQRTLVTEQKTSIEVTYAELNQYSAAVFFRQGLTAITPAASTGVFEVTSGTYTRQLYAAVVDMIDGTNRLRFYFPQVEVTDQGDLNIANGERIEFQVTLSAYPNSVGVTYQVFAAIPALG